MKRAGSLVVLLLLLLSGGSALAQGAPPPQAKGEFKNAAGESIGNLTLTQMPDGTVMVSAAVRGLPAVVHCIPILAFVFSSPNFSAAGPHYTPLSTQHGLDIPNGPHAVDLPNFTVN